MQPRRVTRWPVTLDALSTPSNPLNHPRKVGISRKVNMHGLTFIVFGESLHEGRRDYDQCLRRGRKPPSRSGSQRDSGKVSQSVVCIPASLSFKKLQHMHGSESHWTMELDETRRVAMWLRLSGHASEDELGVSWSLDLHS